MAPLNKYLRNYSRSGILLVMQTAHASLVGGKIRIGRGMLRQEVTVLAADGDVVKLQHAGGKTSVMPSDILDEMRKP